MTAGNESPLSPSTKHELPEGEVRGPFQVSSCAHQISGDSPEGAGSLPPKFRDEMHHAGPFYEEAEILIREAARIPVPQLVLREPPARGAHPIPAPRSYALFAPPANQTEALQEKRIGRSSLPIVPAPERRYECKNYESCLNIAAALNWENFTCGRCCGEVNQQLVWQAQTARRRDGVARALCSGVPELSSEQLVLRPKGF